MSKVKIPFYCTKTKKSYKKGAEYKGDRKDLTHLLYKKGEKEKEDEKKDAWNKLSTKEKKAASEKVGQFGKAKHEADVKKK